jgi:hypothetical protein
MTSVFADRRGKFTRFPPQSQTPILFAVWALFAAALCSFSQASASEPDPYAPKWNPWVEFGGLGGDGDGRGIVEFWSPLMQGPTALFFFDGKFQFIEDNAQEGNAQFGVRKMTPSGWNVGAWVSGDMRETGEGNNFWQVAGGLEALSVKWDLRLNGYLPVTDPQVSPSTAEIVLKRNNIFMIGGEEVALYGFDGEIGYMLFGSPETKPGTRHEFRVYGGGFWFDHSDAIHEVAGPSARLEWRIDNLIPDWGGSRLTFDAGYSHDEVRDDVWQMGARLRIPLGGTKTYAQLNPQARRMQERIERDDDIVTVQSGPEKVFDTLTGVRFDRVAYVNPSITEVSQRAGNNSLLIVNGTVSGPQQLQGNQTLQGGKSTIQVTGLKSGVTTNFTAPGAKATLNNPGNATNLTLLGNNTHVSGLNIQGAGAGNDLNRGIFGGSNKSNVVLDQLQIANVGNDAIFFDEGNRDITVDDVVIQNAGVSGVVFLDRNSDIVISRTTVANAGNNGIFIRDFNAGIVITDTAISDTGLAGIVVNDNNSNVTIANTTIAQAGSQAGSEGIRFFDRNSNVTIADTIITDAAGDGILFQSDNSNVNIARVTIQRPGTSGIAFIDRNSGVSISDTAISGTGDNGIFFANNNSNVAITNALIVDSSDDGIHFLNSNSNVSISGTSIVNTGINGIFFASENNSVAISGTNVADVGNNGIFFGSENNNVAISGTNVADVANNGIFFGNENSNVAISGMSIADVGNSGIFFSFNNRNVRISGTTITNAGGDGLIMLSGNGIALNDSVLAGTFGDDGIDISDAGNTLSGGGNTAAGATFGNVVAGGQFCEVSGAQTGSFAFVDDGTGNPATCPPP